MSVINRATYGTPFVFSLSEQIVCMDSNSTVHVQFSSTDSLIIGFRLWHPVPYFRIDVWEESESGSRRKAGVFLEQRWLPRNSLNPDL